MESLLVLGAAMITLSAPFVVFYREAHDATPVQFGKAMLAVAAVAAVSAPLARLARVASFRVATAYASVVVSGAVAVALAAWSTAIIGEGQVTAMMLPVALCGAVIVGFGVAVIAHGLPVLRARSSWAGVIACAVAVTSIGYALPVVQFRDGGRSNAVYPVFGGAMAFGAALIAATVVGYTQRSATSAMRWSALIVVLVGAYVVQSWFGVALAVLGVVVSHAAGVMERS